MRAVWLFLAASALWAQQYRISTVAGGAPPPTPGPARSLFIGWARGVAADTDGNVYFASADLHCVFKLDGNGILTRIAGNSRPGFSGDGGPAVEAQLNNPAGVALDGAGNLYIEDFSNQRVRRVSRSGTIATVWQTGPGGLFGDNSPIVAGVMAVNSAGEVFLTGGCRVRKLAITGIVSTVAGSDTACGKAGDGGPAAKALLDTVYSIAVDGAGNLFVLTSDGIRKVSTDGSISTVAANAPAGSLTLDSAGNFYIVSNYKQSIVKIASGGEVAQIAGTNQGGFAGDGGPAVSAELYNPEAAAFDGRGNLFVAGPVAIRKIAADGTITTVAGSGWNYYSGDGLPAIDAPLSEPDAVAMDGNGNLFIADLFNFRVREVSPSGIITTIAGNGGQGHSGDGGRATDAQIGYIIGLAVDPAGGVFLTDGSSIRKVSATGMISTVVTAAHTGDVVSIATDASGNLFFGGSGSIQELATDGTIRTVAGTGVPGYWGDGGPALQAQFQYISGLAVDGSGNLFAADGSRIREISPAGMVSTVAGGGSAFPGDNGAATAAQISYPSGVAVDGSGNLFIADYGGGRIRKVTGGTITTIAGGNGGGGCMDGDGGPATLAMLWVPLGVTADASGNVYIPYSGNIDLDFDPWVYCSSVRKLSLSQSAVMVGAVTDAAGGRATPVAPGKMVVIYGAGLGPAQLVQNQPAGGQISTELAGTKVMINGVAAPVLYTSATQVAAVVPYAVSGTAAQVTVEYQGQISDGFAVTVAAAAPSIFTANQTGAGQAAAVNAIDGTVNSPANPVKVGAYLSLFATGEGQTAPAGVDGAVGGAAVKHPVLPVSVTVDGIPATVLYAGSVSGQVAGLLQVNVQIPPGVRAGGFVPVVMQVGNASTVPDAVWIAVGN